MDKITFREYILADNIQNWERMGKRELLNELMDIKWRELEQSTDEEIISQLNKSKYDKQQ